ncbi:hypothetical protein ACSLV1_19460 [Pseudomonas aeruginosa]|uniref:hypothetical protein n=1 Tax=Pseudomonas aeruginosa TaxID=287 RepID=UPI00076C9390|nr:hypothetical protein [Pseudomonas aeruginosa]EIU3495150.1 hypothetical protein [Pseudomonas aeruginosa]MBF8390314.1 hypothetical protein [Pseudomonas aeruginosa]MBK1796367.1 hypothetical protein [Pseudomonas aeruginosa]MBX6799855.1 hypothetical protein [Pseudomonas aeruginosa]MDA3199440.1 hypothetical protein [Pseudomonas aeruginosa]
MSDESNSLLADLPPLTQEALEEEVFNASSKAKFAWENAFASRFLVTNLLLALHHSKVLDGHGLLLALQAQVRAQSPEVLQTADRRALLDMLEELQKMLLAAPVIPGVH